ncbi:hypothetical protein ABT158_24700 [Nonomuraea sp. NPDC001636]|uniref:hypothetical protein n=1 Tax=Nonomuraea sp. NPDC001636 TaxID=3154391 RepID=UPI003320D563
MRSWSGWIGPAGVVLPVEDGFAVSSPQVGGSWRHARALVEASAPRQDVPREERG